MTIYECDYKKANTPTPNDNKSCLREWLNAQTPYQPSDPIYTLHNTTYKTHEKIYPTVQVAKTLDIFLDSPWTFSQQMQYIANKMKLIRFKCNNLIQSNRNTLNMDTISTIIK